LADNKLIYTDKKTDQHRLRILIYNENMSKLLESDLSYKIRGCFYSVFNKYGPGLKEIIYQKALEEEFNKQKIKFHSQKRINIYSLDSGKLLGTYIPDFIVEEKIIVELKANSYLTQIDINQQRSYLRANMYEIAYLVNFGVNKLEIKRSIFTNDRKPFIRVNPSPSIRGNLSSFTLMEILVVISLLIIIAIIVLIALNPSGQINKNNDSKRKHELTQLNKVFEDYYNDKNCYPKPNEVCYNSDGNTTCNICGNESTSPSISPYLSHLPCDPQQPTKKYLYQVDSTICPTWYRIYGTLSNLTDPIIAEVGCQNGCGLSPNFIYNYGVSSPNIGLEINSNMCSLAGSLYINPNCNICGSYTTCKNDFPNKVYYTDPGNCVIACIKD